MQKIVQNAIHMVIPLYLNNFFSGAGLNSRLREGLSISPSLKFFHDHILVSHSFFDQRKPLCQVFRMKVLFLDFPRS